LEKRFGKEKEKKERKNKLPQQPGPPSLFTAQRGPAVFAAAPATR
jgi:hypothetical protein